MTIMEAHETRLNCHENGDVVQIHPAEDDDVAKILARDPKAEDTRSNFVWVRLPNGDLILGVYPQGDTYFEFENNTQYDGPTEGRLWCETCGERPAMVRSDHASLCCHCAAHLIDNPEG